MRSAVHPFAQDPYRDLKLGRAKGIGKDDLATVELTMRKFVMGNLKGLGMDFKVWDWTLPEQYGLILGMFVRSNLARDRATLTSVLEFAIEVADGYKSNPYHSFLHAVDVTYIMYWTLTDMGIAEQLQLNKMELVALLIAALTHDVLHPGLNNLYQVNAHTQIAQRYNDKSVLEAYSCTHVEYLLSKHTFLTYLSYGECAAHTPDPPALIRSIVVEAIMSTDMCHHFHLLEQLSKLTAHQGSYDEEDEEDDTFPVDFGDDYGAEYVDAFMDDLDEDDWDPDDAQPSFAHGLLSIPVNSPAVHTPAPDSVHTNEAIGYFPRMLGQEEDSFRFPATSPANPTVAGQKQKMINAILHAADISNAARPFEICKRWSDMVAEEFFLQGEQEKQKNLPISPNMDRDTTNPIQMGIDFNEYVVRPFFEILSQLFPSMRPFVDILIANSKQWELMSNEALLSEAHTEEIHDQPPSIPPHVRTPDGPMKPARVEAVAASAASGENGVSRGRRLSIAAGTLEIPETFDRLLFKNYKIRYKTSRSLSGGRGSRKPIGGSLRVGNFSFSSATLDVKPAESNGSRTSESVHANANSAARMLARTASIATSTATPESATDPFLLLLGGNSPARRKTVDQFRQRRCMSLDASDSRRILPVSPGESPQLMPYGRGGSSTPHKTFPRPSPPLRDGGRKEGIGTEGDDYIQSGLPVADAESPFKGNGIAQVLVFDGIEDRRGTSPFGWSYSDGGRTPPYSGAGSPSSEGRHKSPFSSELSSNAFAADGSKSYHHMGESSGETGESGGGDDSSSSISSGTNRLPIPAELSRSPLSGELGRSSLLAGRSGSKSPRAHQRRK